MSSPFSSPPVPPRVVALLVLTLGVVGLSINEGMSWARGEVYLIAIVGCPAMVLLAIGGLVEPRVLWSLGPHRKDFPTRIRVAGAVLLVLGLLTSAYLGLVRYPLLPL